MKRVSFHLKSLPEGADPGIFDRISAHFAAEPCLLPVPAEEMQASFDRGEAILAFDGIVAIGFTRLQRLTANDNAAGEWFELGSTWVDQTYRGQHVNVDMYLEFLPHHTDKNILATTTNPRSISVGRDLGFVAVPRRALPEIVWKASCCCPLLKTGEDGPAGCKLAWQEPQQIGDHPCLFRVTRPTAERLGIAAH